jgi:hypothetical protein
MAIRAILAPAIVAALTLTAAGAASASAVIYKADLLGTNESPPNGSPGVGVARIVFDDGANTLSVHVKFSGLVAGDTASHIHCCTAAAATGTAGVATVTPTFTGFPSGVTSGHYFHVFDLTQAGSWNGSFITSHGGTTASAETALGAGLAAGEAYLNIHSTSFPGGEIRGFLTPAPEPEMWALMLGGLGLAGAGLRFRRRAQAA